MSPLMKKLERIPLLKATCTFMLNDSIKFSSNIFVIHWFQLHRRKPTTVDSQWLIYILQKLTASFGSSREMVNDTKNGSMNLFKKIQKEEEEEAYGAHISKFWAIDRRIFQVWNTKLHNSFRNSCVSSPRNTHFG